MIICFRNDLEVYIRKTIVYTNTTAWKPNFAWKLSFPLESKATYLFKPSLENLCGSYQFPNQSFRQIGQGVPKL